MRLRLVPSQTASWEVGVNVAERIRQNTAHRRGAVWLVFFGLLLLIVLGTVNISAAVLRWDVEELAGNGAMSALMLGIILPLFSLACITLIARATDSLLWAALCLGALCAAAGPFLVLAAGGTWTTPTYLAGRWFSGEQLRLSQFTWIAGIPATAMAIGGVIGWTKQIRGSGQSSR